MTVKYLLFAGESYEAAGGWGDFRGTFSTLQEAMNKVNRQTHLRDRFSALNNQFNAAHPWSFGVGVLERDEQWRKFMFVNGMAEMDDTFPDDWAHVIAIPDEGEPEQVATWWGRDGRKAGYWNTGKDESAGEENA